MSTNFAKEFKLYESLFSERKLKLTEDRQAAGPQLYDTELRAYLKTENPDVPAYDKHFDDEENTYDHSGDEYGYTGTLAQIIDKLNEISKNYLIVALVIGPANDKSIDGSLFFAGDLDVTDDSSFEDGLFTEYDDIRVFRNKLIPESEPFMKQFKIEPKGRYDASMGTLEESTTDATTYSFDLDAFNSNKDKMYTDKNNLSSGSVEDGHPYQFKGTYSEIVKKLNSIVAKNYDILMLFVQNDATGEYVLEVDDNTLLSNKLVPADTLFLKGLLDSGEALAEPTVSSAGHKNMPAKANSSSNKKYIIANKSTPTKAEKVFYNFDMNTLYFSIVNLANASIYNSLGDARFYANQMLSMSDMHRIYVLDASTLQEIDSLDYYNDYEDENDYPGYFDAP